MVPQRTAWCPKGLAECFESVPIPVFALVAEETKNNKAYAYHIVAYGAAIIQAIDPEHFLTTAGDTIKVSLEWLSDVTRGKTKCERGALDRGDGQLLHW